MSSLVRPTTPIIPEHPVFAAMRLALAASALGIVAVDPVQPEHLAPLAYATLGLYTLYSVGLYLLIRRRTALGGVGDRWGHWVDVLWYAVLIGLTSGTSSIFFFGFFFAILVASFRWGFGAGLRVTLASVGLFSAIGIAAALYGASFELNRALVRPIYTLVLGYLMAYWGGHELTLKRRLQLLRNVSALSNPRFGVDRTIGTVLEQLRAFYDADTCLTLTREPDGETYQLRRASRDDAESAGQPAVLPPALTQQLLALPATQAIAANPSRRWPWRGHGTIAAVDVPDRSAAHADSALLDAIAETLGAPVLLSVPLRRHESYDGRLYVARTHGAFDLGDVELLLQVVDQVTPVIENIRLIDHLASEAADEERRRIARDLHDSVIQPYIGLQLALGAVQRKHNQRRDVGPDLLRLSELTAEGIAELRGYVRHLRSGGDHSGGLAAAIERFAAKFGAATGIDVAVRTAGDVRCNDRLGAEVFQMVAEGLSNVRRHTAATQATIELAQAHDRLVLKVANEAVVLATSFTPRSIAERAAALGGTAHVEQRADSGTAVVVSIPL